MFTFTYDSNYDRNSVSLIFKNEILEIECCPESYQDLYEDGVKFFAYDSAPCNGEFRFHYDDEKIIFNAAKYGDGQGGCLTLVLKMTKEIRKSLDNALNEWRAIIKTSDK
jgi:hypothetical protein